MGRTLNSQVAIVACPLNISHKMTGYKTRVHLICPLSPRIAFRKASRLNNLNGESGAATSKSPHARKFCGSWPDQGEAEQQISTQTNRSWPYRSRFRVWTCSRPFYLLPPPPQKNPTSVSIKRIKYRTTQGNNEPRSLWQQKLFGRVCPSTFKQSFRLIYPCTLNYEPENIRQ